MKAITFFLPLVFFIASSNAPVKEKTRTYVHPELNFSFSAPGEWKNNPYHTDKLIYEMVNPETGIHVMLWYTGGTESSCENYLVKMADMKGLECDVPVKEEGHGGPAWVLNCRGREKDTEIVKILAALSYVEEYGPDAPERSQGKTYNAVHIAQVWCPAASYQANEQLMEDIVRSLQLERKGS